MAGEGIVVPSYFPLLEKRLAPGSSFLRANRVRMLWSLPFLLAEPGLPWALDWALCLSSGLPTRGCPSRGGWYPLPGGCTHPGHRGRVPHMFPAFVQALRSRCPQVNFPMIFSCHFQMKEQSLTVGCLGIQGRQILLVRAVDACGLMA